MPALILVLLSVCCFAARAAGPAPVWVASGFAQPSSAVYAADTQVIYVSNLGGSAGAAPAGAGFISRLARDGTVIKRDWFRGLKAPRGLGYYYGLLYVADRDELIEIDTGNGRIRHRYASKGATALHDVAVDGQGRVYVSDPGANAIWRLSGEQFTVWVQDSALQGPKGLVLEKGRVIVAGSGSASASASGDGTAGGYLSSVDLTTRAVEPRFAPIGFGALDGVSADGSGGYYVCDAPHGNVYHQLATGENRLWLLLDPGLADLALIPGQRLLVPNTEAGTVSAFALDR